MKPFQKMTDDEFVKNVRLACHMFAQRHYQAENPGCSRADAWAYAARNWRQFEGVALDWLATCEADRESHEQAPLN
jgi:hypothetical protein